MTEFQRYLLIDVLWVVGSAFLLILVLVKIRARRRRRSMEALAAETAAQNATDVRRRDKAAQEHMDHVFGRRALYRRELAQRELDRFYGKRPADEQDPTFKEWLAARGLPVTDEDGVLEEASTE